MLTAGLVTITFRNMEKAEVARIARTASLNALEWGGDVHVPPTDEAAAMEAARMSRENGLRVAAYGSYYRCVGTTEELRREVDAARILGADTVRVWAGKMWSNDADDNYRALVAGNIREMCDYAKGFGIKISPEFHGGTLTDTYDSATRLYHEIERENLELYWQPNQFRDDEYNLAALRAVLPYLGKVHVFSWEGNNRYPLIDGERMWLRYLDIIRGDGRDHDMLLEFVCDGSEEQLYRDAECLHKWLR